jgi:hypothetical protein
MQPQRDHQQHVSRHYREVANSMLYSAQQKRDLLAISRFEFDGNQVKLNGGSPLGDMDCARYREAARAILGEVAFMLLRANFMLAGCNVK